MKLGRQETWAALVTAAFLLFTALFQTLRWADRPEVFVTVETLPAVTLAPEASLPARQGTERTGGGDGENGEDGGHSGESGASGESASGESTAEENGGSGESGADGENGRNIASGADGESGAPGENAPGQSGGSGDTGSAGAYRVNLNTADRKTLMTLSGIGEVLADRIIEWREAHGGFSRVEELTEVKGIGEKLLERNRERLTVGEGG